MSEQPGTGTDDAPGATTHDAGDAADDASFRLGYVPGATPGKWARTWRDRLPDVRLELVLLEADDAAAALADRRVDAAIARLPVDPDVLHAIPLYTEVPVVVVSRDHLLAATTDEETVSGEDLADDVVWLAADDVLYPELGDAPGRRPEAYDDGAGGVVEPERPATAGAAIALVAAGAGVTVVPMSLARLHHRKDVTHRVLDDGPAAPVGLAWLVEGLPGGVQELVEEMIGIVRGRTVNSSRGRAGRERAEQAEVASRGAGERRAGPGRGDGRNDGRSGGRRPRGSGKPGRGRPRGGRGRR